MVIDLTKDSPSEDELNRDVKPVSLPLPTAILFFVSYLWDSVANVV